MNDDERAAAAYERGLLRGQNDERENYYNDSPLSGEWAGESIVELIGDLLSDDDDTDWICDEYERGYRDAFNDRSFRDRWPSVSVAEIARAGYARS